MQLAGGATAVQLNPIELADKAVAANPAGAEGTALQDVLASVSVDACIEAADVPSASTAFTT